LESDTLLVRQAAERNLDAVLFLYAHLHEPTRGPTIVRWGESGRRFSPIYGLLSRIRGVPVSTCVLPILPNLTRGARPYGLIENVVTRREFQNRGFGTALLTHVLDYAWRQGYYKVMLLTGGERATSSGSMISTLPFRTAVKDAITNEAPGIVVDLRFNRGGNDNLASAFAGWFVDRPVFYEYGTCTTPASRSL
jgi:GNAT superfamily N-acetyltransferase